jgi:hypothetical protein
MIRLLRHPHYVLIFFGLLISMIAKTDTWDNPSVKTYYSETKKFKLIVTPKMTSDKYYLWDYYTNNKHPQTKRILRKKERFMRNVSPKDTILIPCTAELYRMKGPDSALIWKRKLLNNVCPIHAIVANDGSSIVTFDNWYSIGYGVNVFVIYDEKGNAKKTYKLEEISPFPLNSYPMSISSLYWRKDARYIDNDRIKIIFENEDHNTTERIYNLKRLEFEKNAP